MLAPDFLTVAAVGFLLGLRHATDADHVVAVTTIVAREPTVRRAAGIGALWGIGHSLTLLVVGGSLIAFRVAMPPRLGLGLEFAVALMLILLGFLNLRGGATQAHDHAHPHDGPGLRPLVIGTVHGLAGSAAIALLVLTTIGSTAWAVAYLAIFGVGTIAGMMLTTALVAAPAALVGARVVRMQRGIRLAAGALSVGFGLVLANEIVTDGGLFSAAPRWTPH